jgi:hypothetical protein
MRNDEGVGQKRQYRFRTRAALARLYKWHIGSAAKTSFAPKPDSALQMQTQLQTKMQMKMQKKT